MTPILKRTVAATAIIVVICQSAYSATDALEPIYDLSCDQIEKSWKKTAGLRSDVIQNIRLLGSLLEDGACEGVNDTFEQNALASLVKQIESITPDLGNKANEHAANAARKLTETTVGFYSDWKLYELAGDHARLSGDLLQAKEHYGNALASFDADNYVSRKPSNGQLMKIHNKLVEVTNVWVQTSASLEEIKNTRAGGPSEGLSLNWRVWAPEVSLIPLKFEYDSTDFSSEGQEIAQSILDDLNTHQVVKLKITGHTDPKGSAQYNLGLSKARAQAVAEFIKSEGFSGEIVLDWKGESEPFEFDNINLYDENTQHAAHRRVAFEVLEKAN